MKPENQLETIQEPSVALMLQGFIERGITAENVAAFSQLVALKERIDARNAEQQFTEAFAAMQGELPTIVATSVIPNRGKYERYEDVWRVVGPILCKHGFAVSFSQQASDRITVTCRLMHKGGHSVDTAFAVRLGGKADSETQADCKASTTAKRNAFLQALNIVIRQDCLQDEDDARNVSLETITPEEAHELSERVRKCGADERAFLDFAQADAFMNIRRDRLDACKRALAKKEAANK